MTDNKIAEIVSLGLKKGILPKYLKKLVRRATGHNPFTRPFRTKKYLIAIYCLADSCSFECFGRNGHGERTFTSGFPETPEKLMEEVDRNLAETASQVLAFNNLGMPTHGESARYCLKNIFDSAKLLRLIPKDANYDPYFERGKATAAETEAKIREFHASLIPV